MFFAARGGAAFSQSTGSTVSGTCGPPKALNEALDAFLREQLREVGGWSWNTGVAAPCGVQCRTGGVAESVRAETILEDSGPRVGNTGEVAMRMLALGGGAEERATGMGMENDGGTIALDAMRWTPLTADVTCLVGTDLPAGGTGVMASGVTVLGCGATDDCRAGCVVTT